MNTNEVRLHGLDLSYFTGKVEAYLRVKGVPYHLIEMDTASFTHCAKITGVSQMPQLEMADGTWLTDSTHIIEWFEQRGLGPVVFPRDPALCFLADVLEDFADEWLWRPAMAYRWVFVEDANFAAERLARGLMRDVPLPVWFKRNLIRFRQRQLFVRGDGVNAKTRDAVLAIYPNVLKKLEALLSVQSYILGLRPTQADFGFFGSMFRHFGSDPTPAALMASVAPSVRAWIERLWNPGASSLWDTAVDAVEPHLALAPLLELVCADYVPYLVANENAVGKGMRKVHWQLKGVTMQTAPSPYRAWCCQRLGQRLQALTPIDRQRVEQWIFASAGTHGRTALLDLSDVATSARVGQPQWNQFARPEKTLKKPADHHWRGY